MCGRFRLVCGDDEIARFFGLDQAPKIPPRYNIKPKEDVLAVRFSVEKGGLEYANLRWGLIPSWAESPNSSYKMINARAETIKTKPTFADPFRKRRCLIPADGFYEWAKVGTKKIPYLFRLREPDHVFAFAGLWERWEKGGLETCTIITTMANQVVGQIHDRMPVIIKKEDVLSWVAPESETFVLERLLKPFPSEQMEAVCLASEGFQLFG